MLRRYLGRLWGDRYFTIETTAWLACGLIAISIGLMWSIRNRETRADRIPDQTQPLAGA